MKLEDVRFTFLGMDSSEAMKNYALEKLSKREDLLENAISLEVAFKEQVTNRGTKEDFRVDISVDLPETPIRVTERGEDNHGRC